jgi:hypothetical protein
MQEQTLLAGKLYCEMGQLYLPQITSKICGKEERISTPRDFEPL